MTIESTGLGVKLVVETEKRPGETVRNLEVEAKTLELLDKRGVSIPAIVMRSALDRAVDSDVSVPT